MQSHSPSRPFGRKNCTCPCRKSDPDIMVMQSAEDRQGYNSSGRLDGSGDRSVLDKGQMAFERSCSIPYTSGAHGADVAPRGRGCDQGTPVGSSRSAVRHGRSAKATNRNPTSSSNCPRTVGGALWLVSYRINPRGCILRLFRTAHSYNIRFRRYLL